ncbi:unnamed protein product [Caenorhabditis angaria]|uniref:Peptidase S54 rhomboid domain-containing protein n=1 Tax=Caenorhabditis angaria TaxID=860376 RepID=A0A9P1NAM3_9PELO|nr:unnamed protein product [Caenorhabditis angaria]
MTNAQYITVKVDEKPRRWEKWGESILTLDQFSKNCRPIFMILLIVFQIIFYFMSLISQVTHDPVKNFQFAFIIYHIIHINFLQFVCNLLIEIYIGIPLEVAHGSVQISFIYFFTSIYFIAYSLLVKDFHVLMGADQFCRVLGYIHVTNLLLNWKSFPKSKIIKRILFIFLLTSLYYLGTVYILSHIPGPKVILQKYHIEVVYASSIVIGILFGFYGFYSGFNNKWLIWYFILAVISLVLFTAAGKIATYAKLD